MKTKLALLAAVILAGIGSTTAIAGKDWNYFPAAPKASEADKPAAMGCCAMGSMDHAKPAEQNAAAPAGMSCHSGDHAAAHAAPAEGAVTKSKSCCK